MPPREPTWHRNLRRSRARARERLQNLAAYEKLSSHHGSEPPDMSVKTILKGLGLLLKAQGQKAGGKAKGKGKGDKGCYCCGSLLHQQKDCPKLLETCYACGEQGHLAHKCPNCPEQNNGKGKAKGKAGKANG